ncbi:MAG: lipoate--protein ligase family protein [Candidatus Gastranaerophilales bacterium]
MKIIPYQIYSGLENMQIDFDLLNFAIDTKQVEPIFRLYGWSPYCVSLGRNQKDDFVDVDLLKRNNIDVVKRLTGGRAILHADEITYSFVCSCDYLKNGQNVVGAYREISQMLIDKFVRLGIDLDFGGEKKPQGHKDYCMLVSTGADLCYQNKKLIGSAQFRKQNYILQHGSILYDYDKNLLETIFKEDIDANLITSIKEIAPNLSKNDVVNELLSNSVVL